MRPLARPVRRLRWPWSKPGQDGRAFTTLVPCEVWGRRAEAASELDAGQLVLFEGKLAKRKKGEQSGEPNKGT